MKIANRCVCCGSLGLEEHPAILSPFVAERTLGWEPCVITDESGLREVPNGTYYPICRTMMCIKCGTIFSDTRFSEEELDNLYWRYQDFNYNARRCFYEKEYENRISLIKESNTKEYVESIENFIGPYVEPLGLRILDWGGDKGENTPFTDIGRAHIYDICGNTPNVGSAITAEETYAYDYDLIVCSNVLEHISAPEAIIWQMSDRMNEDTILYIEVPFENTPFVKKNLWHEHINMFTTKGLTLLLKRCNLDIIKMQIEEAPWEKAMKPFIRILCKKGE